MIETHSSSDIALWDSLDRWYRVIQYVLKRGRAPRGMTDQAYGKLYQSLRTQLHDASEQDTSAIGRVRLSLYRALRPWVHLDTLVHCDRRILRNLEKEVRFVRDRLMPRERWRSHVLNRVAAVALCFAAMAVVIGFLSSDDPRATEVLNRFQSVLGFVDGLRAQVWVAITHSTTNQRLITLAGAMLLVGTFLLRDRRRI